MQKIGADGNFGVNVTIICALPLETLVDTTIQNYQLFHMLENITLKCGLKIQRYSRMQLLTPIPETLQLNIAVPFRLKVVAPSQTETEELHYAISSPHLLQGLTEFKLAPGEGTVVELELIGAETGPAQFINVQQKDMQVDNCGFVENEKMGTCVIAI